METDALGRIRAMSHFIGASTLMTTCKSKMPHQTRHPMQQLAGEAGDLGLAGFEALLHWLLAIARA